LTSTSNSCKKLAQEYVSTPFISLLLIGALDHAGSYRVGVRGEAVP
jgi:hypothetical protein